MLNMGHMSSYVESSGLSQKANPDDDDDIRGYADTARMTIYVAMPIPPGIKRNGLAMSKITTTINTGFELAGGLSSMNHGSEPSYLSFSRNLLLLAIGI
jgi:hypothetical protein